MIPLRCSTSYCAFSIPSLISVGAHQIITLPLAPQLAVVFDFALGETERREKLRHILSISFSLVSGPLPLCLLFASELKKGLHHASQTYTFPGQTLQSSNIF